MLSELPWSVPNYLQTQKLETNSIYEFMGPKVSGVSLLVQLGLPWDSMGSSSWEALAVLFLWR